MRVGIIGRGFGARVVAPAFEATDGCTVVEVTSPRDEAAVSALCARDDVDLISVHSPPFMHLDHVRQALAGGHAVLCDKPFGCNAQEAREMHDRAAAAGVVHLVNFEMRFDPLRERLRALMQSGEIGDVEHVHCSTFLSVARSRRYGWLFDADLGGGWIGAWGSHIIDFVRWSAGEIVDASAQLRTTISSREDAAGQPRPCSAEDGFSAALRTEPGATVSIDSTSTASVNLPSTTIVFGSTATLEVVEDTRILRRDDAGTHEAFQLDGVAADLPAMMRRWAAVVRDTVSQGGSDAELPTFADGVACREVLDRLRQSSQHGLA
jgi:predicted dehydrogenase